MSKYARSFPSSTFKDSAITYVVNDDGRMNVFRTSHLGNPRLLLDDWSLVDFQGFVRQANIVAKDLEAGRTGRASEADTDIVVSETMPRKLDLK